jgi:hypothetical protein
MSQYSTPSDGLDPLIFRGLRVRMGICSSTSYDISRHSVTGRQLPECEPCRPITGVHCVFRRVDERLGGIITHCPNHNTGYLSLVQLTAPGPQLALAPAPYRSGSTATPIDATYPVCSRSSNAPSVHCSSACATALVRLQQRRCPSG